MKALSPLFAHRFVALLLGALLLCSACTATNEREEPLFSFGVIADIQYCDGDPAGVRYYRNSLEKLEAAVHDLNSRHLAFTIHLGDFIDRDLASIDAVMPIYHELNMPAYHLLGNHDYSVLPGQINEVPEKFGLERTYYDFKIKGWHFVVLDGNRMSLYATLEGSAAHAEAKVCLEKLKEEGAVNAAAWNGGLGREQTRWLEKTLEEAELARERVIIFCHFPVYPVDMHNLWNDVEIKAIIEKSGCVAVYICGHNHAGGYAMDQAIHYLTLPGMVDTPDTNAYAWIDLYADRLEVHGVGRAPSRTLSFTPGAKN